MCGDGFGTMPGVRWLYNFADIKRRSSLDLRIDNPYATPITVNLTVASHGLDQRVVKRALGSIQVAAGGNSTFAVNLTLLPIQGVSYSSLGTVELAVDRGTDTIQVINNRGTATTLTSDLWQIYQGVCGGGCSQFGPVTWPALESEADAYFTSQNKMANFLHFEEWGNLAGVNEDP